jgi:hypothetical protein
MFRIILSVLRQAGEALASRAIAPQSLNELDKTHMQEKIG